MRTNELVCGHFILRSDCRHCEALKTKWYARLVASDPDWRDIEYDTSELIYQPLANKVASPLTQEYYDIVRDIYHAWVKDGRSKRDCLVAELLYLQDGHTGTERGISDQLRLRRLRPNSRGAVRRTIWEIRRLVLKKAQPHLNVEQRSALHLLESKPLKEEANGQTTESSSCRRAA